MPMDFLADDNIPTQGNPQNAPRDFLNEYSPKTESLSDSLKLAPVRFGTDILNGVVNFANNIPSYYQFAKSEIPAAFHALHNDPSHALGQFGAGFAESGKNIFNTPHDITNYLTNRLHLFPEDLNKKIQMARMPDQETEQAINAAFGQPTQQGEDLLRGLGRNSTDIAAGIGLGKLLNPLKLTNRGIAKGVTKELSSQVNKHNAMYNDLWDKAQKKGFNQVPYDATQLMNNMSTIEKYTTPKQNQSLIDFMKNPTLPNAQRAQRDAGTLKRILDEKAKTTPLLKEETQLLSVLNDTEKHIEENMFKNSSGEKNQSLADRYHNITKSYAKNVVPYRYNPDIQKYLSKDILASELVQSLSKGSFAAKKGWSHPSIKIRNAILPTAKGIGYLGGGAYLLNQLMGNSTPPNK